MAFLLAAPLLMTAVGCKKDKVEPDPDPTPQVPEEKYLGAWNGDHQMFEVTLGGMPLLSENNELEEGDFILTVLDSDSVELRFIPPGSTEVTTQKQAYEEMDKYTISFVVNIDDPIQLELTAFFKVDEEDLTKGQLLVDEQDVEVQPGMNANIKLEVDATKAE